MQDIKELNDRGIPGGYVASEPFLQAAKSHGRAVGFFADSVFITHPIQDRTDSEISNLAIQFYPEIRSLAFS